MITCTLKDKKYAVDFISGRALREMEPAAKMYAKIVALSNAAVKGEEIPQEEQISVTDAMDVMMVSFDEQLFIRTVEQITVFPDKLVFVFKDGTEIPIDE